MKQSISHICLTDSISNSIQTTMQKYYTDKALFMQYWNVCAVSPSHRNNQQHSA